MRIKYFFMVVAIVSTSPAAAEDPFYYHKAAVNRDVYMADVVRCASLARTASASRGPTTYSPNIYAAMAGAFLSGFLQGGADRNVRQSVERTCMADKGYARVVVAQGEIADILKLKDQARIDALFLLASAPEPIGMVMSE